MEHLDKILLAFNKNSMFADAVIHKLSLDEIKYLVDNGVDPHYDSDRAFVYACWHRNMDIIKYFIQIGADINAHHGRALLTPNVVVMEFLLNNGLIVNDDLIKDVVQEGEANKHIEVLLKYGIDVDLITKFFFERLDFTHKTLKLLDSHGSHFDQVIHQLCMEKN